MYNKIDPPHVLSLQLSLEHFMLLKDGKPYYKEATWRQIDYVKVYVEQNSTVIIWKKCLCKDSSAI